MTAALELAKENSILKQQLLSQEEQLSSQLKRIKLLEEMLRYANQKRFGSSSEKSPQQALFDEAEELDLVEQADTAESNEAIEVPAHTRKKQKRASIPESIEREEVVYDLDESEKVCPHDGHALKQIGEETHEQLDIIPAQIKAIKHIRKKYACPCCEGYIVTAKKPKQPIEKSIAAPGLLAHIAVSKYADALPLYRQAAMFKRSGIELDRSSLANWMIQCGHLIQPLFNRLQDHLLEQDIVHMDETPLQVLNEPGKTAQSKSYMWVMASAVAALPVVLYHYSPSRSQETPNQLLNGYESALMVDGYSGYQPVCEQENIERLGCWAHARRKFIEAQTAQGKNKKAGKAEVALSEIRKLYRIETLSKDLSAKERYQLRQDKAKPILDKMRKWLEKSLPGVPPKTALGKALTYLNNQWACLVRYIENGAYPTDNNHAENKIRPFVIGRKNWLFANSQAGAQASANLYSLIETAKANGVEPYAYLRKAFTDLPNIASIDDIDQLLPWNFKGGIG